MIKCQLIGGPLDGQTREILGGVEYFIFEERTLDHGLNFVSHKYRRTTTHHGGRCGDIFVHQSDDTDRLINNYMMNLNVLPN